MARSVFTAEHEMFRDAVRAFLDQHVVPNHLDWEKQGLVPREVWREDGAFYAPWRQKNMAARGATLVLPQS